VLRVEQVDLEVVAEADVVAVEGRGLDEGDARDVGAFGLVEGLAVAGGEGVLDGEVEAVDVGVD
jgi:hypothetical protein